MVSGLRGTVVSAHALASDAGVQVMMQGGNAFDAAIATQLALAVVYPGAGNLGGGGFMVARTADGKNIALDYREQAPSHASRDMYLDKKGDPVTVLSMEGHFASGVPGSVAGMFETLKYARLPFEILIGPAIKLAEQGFALTPAQALDFNDTRATFLRLNKYPIAFVKKMPWKAGDTLKQPDLAKTLRRMQTQGRRGFYEGLTADLIVQAMKKRRGIITKEDLKAYRIRNREAMQFDHKGLQVITMPLPSSGGIILRQLLKMTEKNNLASFPFQSPASVQLIVEAERRAFADRAEFLGDPDFVKVPVNVLVSDEYLEKRMSDFTPGKAGNSRSTGAGIIHESEQTSHISICDKEGNAVAVTVTLNDHFGNKTIVEGAGFLMNNEMDDFSVKPGTPNMYGAVGNEKNAIAPGKRMLSSMTPTIVLKNNKPYLIVGTPGGTTIPTSVFQAIVNIVDYNLDPRDAINKPKFHHQWLPDVIYLETGFPDSTRKTLEAMGYSITDKSSIGRTELIVADDIRRPETTEVKDPRTYRPAYQRMIIGFADRRGDDDARGW